MCLCLCVRVHPNSYNCFALLSQDNPGKTSAICCWVHCALHDFPPHYGDKMEEAGWSWELIEETTKAFIQDWRRWFVLWCRHDHCVVRLSPPGYWHFVAVGEARGEDDLFTPELLHQSRIWFLHNLVLDLQDRISAAGVGERVC